MNVLKIFKSVNSLSPSGVFKKTKPRELKHRETTKRKFSQVGVNFVRVTVRDIEKLKIETL